MRTEKYPRLKAADSFPDIAVELGCRCDSHHRHFEQHHGNCLVEARLTIWARVADYIMALPSVGRQGYDQLETDIPGTDTMENPTAIVECRICQGADSGLFILSCILPLNLTYALFNI